MMTELSDSDRKKISKLAREISYHREPVEATIEKLNDAMQINSEAIIAHVKNTLRRDGEFFSITVDGEIAKMIEAIRVSNR